MFILDLNCLFYILLYLVWEDPFLIGCTNKAIIIIIIIIIIIFITITIIIIIIISSSSISIISIRISIIRTLRKREKKLSVF